MFLQGREFFPEDLCSKNTVIYIFLFIKYFTAFSMRNVLSFVSIVIQLYVNEIVYYIMAVSLLLYVCFVFKREKIIFCDLFFIIKLRALWCAFITLVWNLLNERTAKWKIFDCCWTCKQIYFLTLLTLWKVIAGCLKNNRFITLKLF